MTISSPLHAKRSPLLGAQGGQESDLRFSPDVFAFSVLIPDHDEGKDFVKRARKGRKAPIRKHAFLVDDSIDDTSHGPMPRFRNDGLNSFTCLRHGMIPGYGRTCTEGKPGNGRDGLPSRCISKHRLPPSPPVVARPRSPAGQQFPLHDRTCR